MNKKEHLEISISSPYDEWRAYAVRLQGVMNLKMFTQQNSSARTGFALGIGQSTLGRNVIVRCTVRGQ